MELRTLRDEDLEQAWELDADSFHEPEERKQRFLRWSEPARLIGLFDDGRLVALTAAHPFGQFFGGRSVPMGGLASVSVAPDRRGDGCARRVITGALEAMRERGEVISTLFPAMTRLYRGLGWEVAGHTLWRAVTPRSLQSLPRPARARVRPGDAGDLPAIGACYDRLARSVNGFVDRPEHWWGRISESWPRRGIFLAGAEGGEVEGYLVYRQIDGEHRAFGGPFGLRVDDLVATSREAALALWRLLGSWASQVEWVVYRGPAEDPLLLLLPEQDLQVRAEIRWMTRIVDAVGAIEARGFPPGVEIDVQIELRDTILAGNARRFVLSVRGGRGRLEPGGRGSLVLDVGAFSALYTGWASASLLARAERLSGGSPEERGALDAAFAGPTPWMLDEF